MQRGSRYRAEELLHGGWVLVTESDDFVVANAAANDLLRTKARGVRVVDTHRDPETHDQVVWALTR